MKVYWAENQYARNTELCFACRVKKLEQATLLLIGKDVYNVYVNGQFIHYGPARAAKGYARLDRLEIGSYLTEEVNVVTVYVQSVYTKAHYIATETPLFGAEIIVGGKTTYTAEDFIAYQMTDRVVKVEKMSIQRGYLEIYRMKKAREPFDFEAFPKVKKIEVPAPIILERGVKYADNRIIEAVLTEQGSVIYDPECVWENDYTRQLDSGRELYSYTRAECDCVLSKELLALKCDRTKTDSDIKYATYAFERVRCGKFRIKVTAKQKLFLWLTYDDILIDGYIKFNREQIIHGAKWELQPGEYLLETQEVYEAKYITLIADGEIKIDGVSVICIENPDARHFKPDCGDEELNKIVKAAGNSFAHNAYDLPTDCPSRERAGYLCDGYFTAIAERFYTNDNLVEKNFLENYALYKNEHFNDDGVLPMCYPSEPKNTQNFIPNWILWFIVQLEDHVRRTGEAAFAESQKKKVYEIVKFFGKYENEYGLLENLPGWVFVEWSAANDFVYDVNFPSNMLYYGALMSAGRLMKDKALLEKAERLKRSVIDFSYNGELFIDNAVRVEGKLELTANVSETCQNYAAFFEIFKKEENPRFYQTLIRKFGAFFAKDEYPHVHPSNMFIGYILRLMILFREEEYELLLRECKVKFGEMAKRTGTIWELFAENASCNHGFGSVIGKLIVESVEAIKNKEKGVVEWEK